MYTPSHFREDAVDVMQDLMKEHSFAILVTHGTEGLFATHLPFLFDAASGPYGTLRAHMARANPQWQQFHDDQEAMIIFQGPHAYISPTWYANHPSVPTWNYVVVHAYGFPRLLDDAGLYTVLKNIVEQHEAGREPPWQLSSLADEYVTKMMRAVVGFEMEITRLEGKVKMSQNRAETDLKGAIEGLLQTGYPSDIEVAEWMQRALVVK